jgi:predicted metalloprotease with PDZ domain
MTDNKTQKTRSKKAQARKKTNLLRLSSEMNKISLDAVDKEVIKRFRIIIDTCDEDITKASLTQVLKNVKEVDVNSFHESLQPYIKHYLFMMKRSKK